jgi:hypothetical protein
LRAFDAGLLPPDEIAAVAEWLETDPETEQRLRQLVDGKRNPTIEALRQPCPLTPELAELSTLTSHVVERVLSEDNPQTAPPAPVPERLREYQILRSSAT